MISGYEKSEIPMCMSYEIMSMRDVETKRVFTSLLTIDTELGKSKELHLYTITTK